MNKRGAWWLWVSIGLAVFLIIVAFLYFALFRQDNSGLYSQVQIKNPAAGMSSAEAIAAFDESFVSYLLYAIKAYNLHNPPLSSDYPKLEIRVEDQTYGASVIKGIINVSKGAMADKDVIIKTTKEEAVKMMGDRNYVTKSFNDGKSTIELVASKTTLFAKGYLGMYTELTGKSVTGNLIRISTG